MEPTAGEPLPRILKGIVTHARDIRVMITRSNFTLNPTNCNSTQIVASITSVQGQSATGASRYQASSCAALKFQPRLAASTDGHTSRLNGTSLRVRLTFPNTPLGTQTNIAKVKVELPKALPARLETLQKSCIASVFDSNPADCPATAVVGYAKAITPLLPVPLQGPAYLVSHGNEAFRYLFAFECLGGGSGWPTRPPMLLSG